MRLTAWPLLLGLALLASGCFSRAEQALPAASPALPPPVPGLSDVPQGVPAENAIPLASTAVAAIPTQAAAPAAAPLTTSSRLLLATTRPSPRPKSDLPIDYRLAILSNRGLEAIDLPGEDDGVVDAAVNRDGEGVAIVGGDRILRFRVGADSFSDLLPSAGPTTAGRASAFLAVSWLGNQQILVRQPGPPTLFTVQPDGTNRRDLPGSGLGPSGSPDGSRLAVGFVRDELYYSIHVTDLAFSQPRKLTSDVVTESSAAWSPDGQWIAYAANAGFADRPTPTVAWEIRIIRPDGTGQRTLVPRAAGVSYPEIRWSPDSSRIAFTRYAATAKTRQVAVVGIDGSGLTTISDGTANDRILAWL